MKLILMTALLMTSINAISASTPSKEVETKNEFKLPEETLRALAFTSSPGAYLLKRKQIKKLKDFDDVIYKMSKIDSDIPLLTSDISALNSRIRELNRNKTKFITDIQAKQQELAKFNINSQPLSIRADIERELTRLQDRIKEIDTQISKYATELTEQQGNLKTKMDLYIDKKMSNHPFRNILANRYLMALNTLQFAEMHYYLLLSEQEVSLIPTSNLSLDILSTNAYKQLCDLNKAKWAKMEESQEDAEIEAAYKEIADARYKDDKYLDPKHLSFLARKHVDSYCRDSFEDARGNVKDAFDDLEEEVEIIGSSEQ